MKKDKYDLVGKKFGYLTVLETTRNESSQIICKCQCDCGKITHVVAWKLVHETRSCGCMRSHNRFLTLNGETKTLSQWAKEKNCKPQVLLDRFRNGWTVEETLTIPIGQRRKLLKKDSLSE